MLSTLHSSSSSLLLQHHHHSNSSSSTRRSSIPFRHPLQSLQPMDDARDSFHPMAKASQDSLPQASSSTRSVIQPLKEIHAAHIPNSSRVSSSRHHPHPPSSSSSRRASLPLFVSTQTGGGSHPYHLPSPRYRHRPSISSVATTNSTSTSTTDDVLVLPNTANNGSSLPGIYRDMQSYVFGAGGAGPSSSSQATPSANNPFGNTASTGGLFPTASSISRQSSSSMGITVSAPIPGSAFLFRHQQRRSSRNEDSEMNDNSDVGSAYTPEDDASSRWGGERDRASDLVRMDIDLDRKLSRDLTVSTNASKRSPPKGKEKENHKEKQRRNGATTASTQSYYNTTTSTSEDPTTTDEEDVHRQSERSKMRAIDDGSRRPSLPSNVPNANPFASAGLAPLSVISDPFAHHRDDREPRASTSTSAGSPSTPTAPKFSPFSPPPSTVRRPPAPAPAPMGLSSSDQGPSSSSTSSQDKDKGGRARSRSSAAKPLPSLPSNAGFNPAWVPPWAAKGRSANAEPDETPSPPGLFPPGMNPFLLSSKDASQRNPFTRERSTTVTQSTVAAGSSGSKNGQPKIVNTSPSPPPPAPALPAVIVPRYDPTPTITTDATADFDIDFIMTGVLPAAASSSNSNSHPPSSSTRLIVSTDMAGRKPSLAPSIEDTFLCLVNKLDDSYGERRDRWSYRIERPAGGGAGGEYWKCECMGRYWVGREVYAPDDVAGGGLDGLLGESSILVRFCPPEKETPSGTTVVVAGSKDKGKAPIRGTGHTPTSSLSSNSHTHTNSWGSSQDHQGPISPTLTPSQKRSNVRVQVKKMPRMPAFTLYLGPRAPRAVANNRPSILLAPKSYHLHAAKSVVPSRSGTPGGEWHLGMTPSPSPTLRLPGTGTPKQQQQQRRAVSNDYEMKPLRSNTMNSATTNGTGSTPSVSLDLMSVAAAAGRINSAHNQAFDTLSPDEGQAVLEHLKHRSSIGVRLKRAFGGINGSGPSRDGVGGASGSTGTNGSVGTASQGSTSSDHHHSHHQARSTSPDQRQHHPGRGAGDALYEPPWMLMTPMYVKEAVIAAERSMYTGFASLGLAAASSSSSSSNNNGKKKAGQSSKAVVVQPPSPTMRRNSILESVPTEAMCMVLPLWDIALDMEEDRKRRRQAVDDLDLDLDDLEEEDEDEVEEEVVDEMLGSSSGGGGGGMSPTTPTDPEAAERRRLAREMARRRKLIPPPKTERKYLLAYYVPFNSGSSSTTRRSSMTPSPVQSNERSSKKRPRQGGAESSERGAKGLPVRSFRVVARILSPAELRDSGLTAPRNLVDPKRMQQQSTQYHHHHPHQPQYYSSSLNYQRMDRRLSSSSILGESVVPSSFSAVIAVCHDRRRGVEFIPEGLDSLGLCGDETVLGPNGTVEKLPPLFPPAHMVPVSERRTPPLNAVGRQIVEMIWSGCLALTELGI